MKKVLIADDSVTVIKMLSCHLSDYDAERFEILKAKDGADALFALKENDVDVVFLDIMMPIVDGYGVVDFIKDRKLNVEIVIITANLDRDTIMTLGKLGVKHFLPKPIKHERMKNILDKLVAKND